MTREEKQKAVDALKISAPVTAMTQEEFNDYIQTLNKIMDWLEQEPILDKIRAEIEDLDRFYDNDYFSGNRDSMFKCNEVIEILDKYKAETEDKR